jgi:L-rhamnose mutarotase
MKELIEEYIIDNYMFSSNIDGWCIVDKHSQRNLLLQRLISDIERIFPDMGSTEVCTHWWGKNINIITTKISTHMCTYHLRMGNGPKVWEVVNGFGKPFHIKTLRNILPIHHNESAIYKAYDEWFDEKILEATKIQMGIK